MADATHNKPRATGCESLIVTFEGRRNLILIAAVLYFTKDLRSSRVQMLEKVQQLLRIDRCLLVILI